MLFCVANKYKLWLREETLAVTIHEPVTIVFIISVLINNVNTTITGIMCKRYSGLITVDYTNNIM